MQDKIFNMLLNEDELTWQTIIMDLVKSEQMNPWDIHVSDLAKKYIDVVRKLKEHDFRISGKVLLAAAVLLKLKTDRLVSEDINELDSIISSAETMDEEQFYEELEDHLAGSSSFYQDEEKPRLIPRTPQPRKRKVSVYDLMNALEKALDVKHRRVDRDMPGPAPSAPDKVVDITRVIRDVYGNIVTFFTSNKKGNLAFSQLLPDNAGREERIFTFIPLLHLTNQRKIDIEQEGHLSDIDIQLLQSKKAVDKELGII